MTNKIYMDLLMLLEYLNQIDEEEESLKNSTTFVRNIITKEMGTFVISKKNSDLKSFDITSVDYETFFRTILFNLQMILQAKGRDQRTKLLVEPLIEYTRKKLAANLRESIIESGRGK